ncbi:MAG: 50S ribosomal protein L18 [Clostridia bacterium]|nr:50S ribosomal protein L18 [Clostridia bacterium]
MFKPVDKKAMRAKKRLRIRKKIHGTGERPRLCVFRSSRHIYAQIIDDTKGHTLVAVSTLEPALRDKLPSTHSKEAAKEVGKLLGEKAVARGISRVVFDRSGYLYHGRVAALAEGAREAGLEF